MNRLVSPQTAKNELSLEKAMRPKSLDGFLGQRQICSNLKVFLKAARMREEPLDHVLLSGPPGLGKTTLAHIIANEMNASFKVTSGPILTKTGDLAAIITNLGKGDVLFIDEIHRMHPSVEEMLYSAMEDFKIDIMIGEGQSAKSLRLDLPQFTIIAATTRLGLLSQPLRERFGIPFRFDFYEIEDLQKIILMNSKILDLDLSDSASQEIARRSRGTPRIALRLLRRIRDFASILSVNQVSETIVCESLNKLNVDPLGLDTDDKKYISAIQDLFNGGPVGIETIAAALSEDSNTLEEVIEPYLIQRGLILKTPRGRLLTPSGKNYFT